MIETAFGCPSPNNGNKTHFLRFFFFFKSKKYKGIKGAYWI